MAKEKKVPQFDPDLPAGTALMGDKKYLVQGKGEHSKLFSYAEPGGPWTKEKGRAMHPTPKFVMYKKTYDLAIKKERYAKLQLETFSHSTALSALEKELKAEGVLEDTS